MTNFDIKTFTPYLLNLAAEASSLSFQPHYKGAYGMLRTEWRVLFHLGRYGEMPAKDICTRAGLHKTKVSRAVAALEKKRFVKREVAAHDRRHEILAITAQGQTTYQKLCATAEAFDEDLMRDFSRQDRETLRRCLEKLAGI